MRIPLCKVRGGFTTEEKDTMHSVLIAVLALIAVAMAVIFTVSALVPVGAEDELDPAGSGGANRGQEPEKQDLSIASGAAEQAGFEADNYNIIPDAVETLSKTKEGWGLGPAKNDKGQPEDALSYQQRYEPLGAYFVFPEDDNIIYLTFDLGYENGYTPQILDTLKEKGVKATFFITKEYVDDAPDIVRRIIDEGHCLGNHTMSHPSIPTVSDDRVKSEISELHHYILENYGYTMTLFRYPMGEFSEYTLEMINNMGYKSVFWSFAYKDWITDTQPDPAASLDKITDALHPGAIYLLHAVSSTNAAILGDFIDNASAKGYTFKLVDERLGTGDTSRASGIGSII